nr:hypothetical protein [Lasius neglectus picorna-like virus 8]
MDTNTAWTPAATHPLQNIQPTQIPSIQRSSPTPAISSQMQNFQRDTGPRPPRMTTTDFERMWNQRSNPGTQGLGYDPAQNARPKINFLNNSPKPSGGGGGFMSSLGNLASASVAGAAAGVVGGIFGVISSAIDAGATRYTAEEQLKGVKYSADQNLTGTKYKADTDLAGTKYVSDLSYRGLQDQLKQQYTMWDRDYKIANQMGFYHPAQLTNFGQRAPTDMLSLSQRGLRRTPRGVRNTNFATIG